MSSDFQAAPPAAQAKSGGFPWRWVLILVVLAVAGWFVYRHFKAAPADAGGAAGSPAAGSGAAGAAGPGAGGGRRAGMGGGPPAVSMAAVKSGDVNIVLNALGTVTAGSTVVVHPRVDGLLAKVNFREGQQVKAGQVLAEIDAAPFEAALAQVQGALTRDEALLKNAKLDLERYRGLLKEDSIAAQQVDTQEALVHQYEGTVQADRGQVDNARLQLGYTRVKAPAEGQVGLRLVDAGNMVHASDTTGLVVINQTQPINIIFSVPQDNLPALIKRLQDPAPVPVGAWDRDGKNRIAGGRLVTIDNQVDTTTGTVKLKAMFRNEEHELFPNQFVNVHVIVNTLHDAVLAPTAAIQRGTPGIYVYVVADDQTVSLRTVTLGPVDGDVVAISDGLKPGERVVIDGADKLREGMKVQAVVVDLGTKGSGRRGRRGQGGAAAGAGASAVSPADAAARANQPPAPASDSGAPAGHKWGGAEGKGMGKGMDESKGDGSQHHWRKNQDAAAPAKE